jgi:hypothetical protein
MSSIAELATLVTVAGVAIYVAGLLGLTIAIRLRLTEDIATAWYAVTLLPRTDVAGQGVKIWLLWPLPVALLLVMLEPLAELLGTSYADMLEKVIPILAVSGLLISALFSVLTLRYIQKEQTKSYITVTTKNYIAATFIATLGALFMSKGALLIVQGAREADISILQVLTDGAFFGPIVFLCGSFFVGVAGAAVHNQPLPQVQIESDQTANVPACFTKPLYLVTRAEGCWHFLDDKNNELVSVPDRLVSAVHTLPNQR